MGNTTKYKDKRNKRNRHARSGRSVATGRSVEYPSCGSGGRLTDRQLEHYYLSKYGD